MNTKEMYGDVKIGALLIGTAVAYYTLAVAGFLLVVWVLVQLYSLAVWLCSLAVWVSSSISLPLVAVMVAVVVVFLPTIVAFRRKAVHRYTIAFLNLTGALWIVALLWACFGRTEAPTK